MVELVLDERTRNAQAAADHSSINKVDVEQRSKCDAPGELTAQRKTPFVYWSQDLRHIRLRVDIRDPKTATVRVLEGGSRVEFEAKTLDGTMYAFSLPLIFKLKGECEEPQKGFMKLHGQRVELCFLKTQPEIWKKLTEQRFRWLQFDFDRWVNDDDTNSESEAASKQRKHDEYIENLMRQIRNDEAQLTADDKLKRQIFLVIFNSGMWLAYLYLLSCFLLGWVLNGNYYFGFFWERNWEAVIACTCFQYIEVINALCGVTRAGWKMAFMQITGRLFILALVKANPGCQRWWATFVLLVIYCLSEQLRYPLYAIQAAEWKMPWLTRARYNVSLLLYPLGFLYEGMIMASCVPYFYSTEKWSLTLPNALNFSWNFGVVLALFLVTGFPMIIYSLFTHLLRQRLAKLSDSRKKKIS